MTNNTKGVDWVLVRVFQRRENLSDTKLSGLLGVARRTLTNWRNDSDFYKTHKDEIAVISSIFKQNSNAFIKGTPENTQLWVDEVLTAHKLDSEEKPRVRIARTNNGSYNGTIIDILPNKVIQRWEDDGRIHGYVSHVGVNLVQGCENIKVNKKVNISYKNGQGKVRAIEMLVENQLER